MEATSSSVINLYSCRMVRASKTATEDPDVPGAVSAAEARLFHDIVRKQGPLPEGVRTVDLRLGEDSSGAPAVWIVIVAEDDLNPSDESIAAIRRLGEKVRSDVLSTGSERWPYVMIEAE